jgi:hypothetical protein
LAANEGLFDTFRQFYTTNEVLIEVLLTEDLALTTLNGDVPAARNTVYSLLQLVNGFVSPGAPPNWESVKVLEDIFPDANEVIDRLFGLISSFGNLLQDSTQELQATVDGVQDRLRVINALLTQIDTLLESVTALLAVDFDINLLYIPPGVGGNSRVVSEVLTATNPPDAGADEYFMAIALLGGTTGIFSLIFGV